MKEVKALAVMTRPELEQALADVNVTRRLQHKLIELQQARIRVLREALVDAERLCKWSLQSGVSKAEKERVTREHGITYALIIAQPEPRP